MPARIDFEAERDRLSTSWDRADPRQALIEQFGRYGYRITLVGGDAHIAALGRDGDLCLGRCDCDGYHYGQQRDDSTSACAHLCTIAKADVVGVRDAHGDCITIEDVDDDTIRTDPDHHADRVRSDAGNLITDGGFTTAEQPRARKARTHASPSDTHTGVSYGLRLDPGFAGPSCDYPAYDATRSRHTFQRGDE